jgi:heme/copper-type cytochrome/quinol oxidase subunit 3
LTPVEQGDSKGATLMDAEAAEHAHHKLMPGDWPADAHYGTATSGKIGMWIFLLSDALTFAGLLLAYAILRGGSARWIPEGAPILGLKFTAVLTFLLICSSVTMVLAFAAAVERDRKATVKFLCLTILGGLLFLCGQFKEYFGIEWLGHLVGGNIGEQIATGLTDEGLIFGKSHYATTFYLITSFHGAHVFSGCTYLTVIMIRTAMGKYDDGNYNHVEIVGLFWHFVDLIWILVFTFVYLIPK